MSIENLVSLADGIRGVVHSLLRGRGWLELAGSLDAAIQAYQKWANLEPHGRLDEPTVRSILAPRFCGCRDVLPVLASAARPRWNKTRLRWCLQGSLPGLSAADRKTAVQQALDSWARVCGLAFEVVDDPRAADVVSGVRVIDGPFGVLAESELPPGDDRQLGQWFDSSESWVLAAADPGGGRLDLVRVFAHENGHALGLQHTPPGTGALMDPTYSWAVRGPTRIDTANIVALYGPPVAQPVPPPLPPANTGRQKLTVLIEGGKVISSTLEAA